MTRPTSAPTRQSKRTNLTQNNTIDAARLGDASDNDMDHSERSDASRDLFFGLEGNDQLNGHEGTDYLYGGLGNDILISRGINSRLFGEENDDRLVVAGQGSVAAGGLGSDILDATQVIDLEHGFIPVTYNYEKGEGRDKITTAIIEAGEELYYILTGVNLIIKGYSRDEINVVWDYAVYNTHNGPNDDFWYQEFRGNAALVFEGNPDDSIFVGEWQGRLWDTNKDGVWDYDSPSLGIGTTIDVFRRNSSNYIEFDWDDITQGDVNPYDVVIT